MNALSALYMYIKNMFGEEEGQDMIEYALIIVVFVLVAVVGLSALGGSVADLWTNIQGMLGGAAGG